MLEPSPSMVASFNRQLQAAGETKARRLRCVWGEKDYGVFRWVIQAQLPDDIHGQCVQEFEMFHEERFEDKMIKDAAGLIKGRFRYDKVNPNVLIHIVQDTFYDLDDERGYRMPSERDMAVVWNWMHEFDTVEQQMRTLRHEKEQVERRQREERVGCLAQDIKDSHYLWGTEVIDIQKHKILEGTEI